MTQVDWTAERRKWQPGEEDYGSEPHLSTCPVVTGTLSSIPCKDEVLGAVVQALLSPPRPGWSIGHE